MGLGWRLVSSVFFSNNVITSSLDGAALGKNAASFNLIV